MEEGLETQRRLRALGKLMYLFTSRHFFHRQEEDILSKCFPKERGLVGNLGKPKVLIFQMSPQIRTKCQLTLSNRQVEVVRSYVYLGVTFSASLSLLEKQCHQAYFQEPRTKRWFVNALVTPSLIYVTMVWDLSFSTFHVVAN